MLFTYPRGKRGIVSVTDLARFIFCPYLLLIEKITPKRITEGMKRGLEMHRRAYEEHRRKATEMTLEEAVRMSYEEPMDGREVWMSDGMVHGIADRVIVQEGSITVIEYKTGRSVSSKISQIQALIYGVLASEVVDDVEFQVRDFGERIYFQGWVGDVERDMVRGAVQEYMKSIRHGRFVKREERCESCPLRGRCPF